MRTRAPLSLIAHVAVCVVLGCVFLWIAAFNVAHGGRFGPMLPFHSTNSYLAAAIKTNAASERLLDLFSLLPKDAPIALVYREDEEIDTFIAFAVMYFAWPRPVKYFPVRRDNAASELQSLAATPVSATFFCGVMPPPNTERLVRIGDGLAVAPRN